MPAEYAERRWMSRDGLQLYARDYPAGPGPARLPVICLHGLTRNSKDFEEFAPLVAATGRRVLVPDIRGRGQSPRDPEPRNYQPPTYARDVLTLMDSLGIARALFVGTSMGGIIAMTIAAMRLRAIGGAILNDVGPEIAPQAVERILAYAGKSAEIRSWDDADAYMRETMGVAFPRFGDADWRRLSKRTFRAGKSGPEFDYDPAIRAPLRMPSKWTTAIAWLLFRRLAGRRPTLLVRGAISDVLSREIADRMKRNAPALRQAVVPNVGHAPLLTEPEAFAAIGDFLGQLP